MGCMESCNMFAEARKLSNLFYFLALCFLKLAVIVSFQNEVQSLVFSFMFVQLKLHGEFDLLFPHWNFLM